MRNNVLKWINAAGLCLLCGCGQLFESTQASSGIADVSIEIPTHDDLEAAGSLSAAGYQKSGMISSQSAATGQGGWGLPYPSSLREITCFSVAAQWKEQSEGSNSCVAGSETRFVPGLFMGLMGHGSRVDFKIPFGLGRKVYLLGYAATSPSVCVNLFSNNGPPKSLLSAPVIIGEITFDLKQGKQAIKFEPEFGKAFPIEECKGPMFDTQVDPVSSPKPAITLVEPAMGPATGGTALSIYGTGFKADSQVAVGGVACASAVVASATQINCVTPAGTDGRSQITITNSDGQKAIADFAYLSSGLKVADVTVNEGANAIFTVSLSSPATQPVTFLYATQSLTAYNNVHFESKVGTGTILPGQTSTTVSVATLGNNLDEADKQFLLKISNVKNASVVDDVATGTIRDDDEAAPAAGTGTEVHMVSVYESEVPRSAGIHPTGDIAVEVIAGAKPMILVLSSYEPVRWVLTGSVNSVSKVIVNGYHDQSVTGIDASKVQESSYEGTGSMYFGQFAYDFTNEAGKSFRAYVEHNTGYAVTSAQGAYRKGRFVINGTEAAPVAPAPAVMSLELEKAQTAEGTSAVLRVKLDKAAGVPVTFSFKTTDETARSGLDFTGGTGTGAMCATCTVGQFLIPLTTDALTEGNETFRVELFNVAGAKLGPQYFTRVTVTDTVGAAPSGLPKLSVANAVVVEGGTAQVNFTMDKAAAGSVSFKYRMIAGSAAAGADYSDAGNTVTIVAGWRNGTIKLPTIEDSSVESAETFSVELYDLVGAELASATPAQVTISDNDGTAVYANSLQGTAVCMQFDTSGARTNYANVSEASCRSDSVWYFNTYRADKAGWTVYVNSPSNPRLIYEHKPEIAAQIPRSAVLKLSAYTTAASFARGPGAKYAMIGVSLSAASQTDTYVEYRTVDGNAVSGTDYVGIKGRVLIPAGMKQGTAIVDVLIGASSAGKQFFVEFYNPTTGVEIIQGSTVVTIN